MRESKFEWDPAKSAANLERHQVDFVEAQSAFLDPRRLIAVDSLHSDAEPRYFCIGFGPRGVLTVRFTYRNAIIRIIGAGYWRKGRRLYEQQNEGR